MENCGYGIALFTDKCNPIFYVASVYTDGTGHYHAFLSTSIDDVRPFYYPKTCKRICRDILKTMPDYKACCFKL